MKVSDYIVNFLIEKGVTDVFGIPGGVVLDFLDSIGKRSGEITARLNYNEQASALAACGYAQASGKLAVAYATRGPGITNMITGIANSFCDSLPVFFITAHSHKETLSGIRIEENQEFNTVKMLSTLTKYAVNIEQIDDVCYELEKSYHLALDGRPGPVFIDFLTSVLKSNITPEFQRTFIKSESIFDEFSSNKAIIDCIKQELSKSKRPIILIGDGIKLSETTEYIKVIAHKWNIPVLSSRYAQDIIPDFENYYGYIGSHATRYSNFILSKCDLIISLGNRLMFKPNSKSFGVITDRAKIIRIEVDKNEFLREIPNSICFISDLKRIMPVLADISFEWQGNTDWKFLCKNIKNTLLNYDTGFPVGIISEIIKNTERQAILTSDVGNNEFWLSIAYAFSGVSNRVLYSKSFEVLGCSLPKAIGAYYSTKSRIFCFTGDQGLQMNIQELQFIIKENLPISIILLNNIKSGMIYDEQKKYFSSRFLCTTNTDGYSVPDFEKIANAYGIKYFRYNNNINEILLVFNNNANEPVFFEIQIKENDYEIPYLPIGYAMQNLVPEIDIDIYKKLENNEK